MNNIRNFVKWLLQCGFFGAGCGAGAGFCSALLFSVSLHISSGIPAHISDCIPVCIAGMILGAVGGLVGGVAGGSLSRLPGGRWSRHVGWSLGGFIGGMSPWSIFVGPAMLAGGVGDHSVSLSFWPGVSGAIGALVALCAARFAPTLRRPPVSPSGRPTLLRLPFEHL